MWLTDGIFNGADLLMYLGAFAAIYFWYRHAKRKEAARQEQEEQQD